ncbi:MAG: hypothetical protein QXD43_01095 [Candidatus Aenigmatarchaeota archaeon]
MKKARYDLATIFFIGIIIFSIIGTVLPIKREIIWLLLGICGAIVAIQNIQIREENSFLIATSALVIILTAFLLIPELATIANSVIGTFFINLIVGFGIAGFIVALGLITRLGLEK